MAVILQQVMPAGVSIDMVDEVTAEMGVDSSPPVGLLVHTHYEHDGRVHVMDVWESAEAHQSFAESRLMPAMGKVAAARGIDLAAAGPPDVVFTDVHRVVRGA
ncbi:MAG: hypothetical protein JWP14_45 [Frankiales bacterium]|jgi:hypothetical protein|nr:hypothetical protein [Frankiales bacterium]